MKSLKIIGSTKDLRTNTNIIYAQIDINEYLEFVGEDFDRFEIQRKREHHRGYSRMKKDILAGAQLPPITLAINPEIAEGFINLIEENKLNILQDKIKETNQIYILDGLQRTYIISDLNKDKKDLKIGQKLLLEIWFEKNIDNLIYRLIVLNAGQKPMSLRHQVELLFVTMQANLEKSIPGLNIYKEREEKKRTKPNKFPFDRIVTAYYAYMTKSPEVKRENIVVKNMAENTIFDSQEEDLASTYYEYRDYLLKYCELDVEVFKTYSSFDNNEIRSPKNWLADENVINSFFSAVAQYGIDEKRIKRVDSAIRTLNSKLKNNSLGNDPFDLIVFSKIRQSFNPKKINIGFATRKLLNNGFKEFFREEGEISFEECWKLSVE